MEGPGRWPLEARPLPSSSVVLPGVTKMAADPVDELIASWRTDAEVLDRHGHDREAERLRQQAEEVEHALRRRRSEMLTVAEAAEESGYSEKHLRRLVREGKLEAERPGGDGGRILLPRGALPRKASGDAAGPSPVERHLKRVEGTP